MVVFRRKTKAKRQRPWTIKEMLHKIAWPIGEARELGWWCYLFSTTPILLAIIGGSLIVSWLCIPDMPPSRLSWLGEVGVHIWAEFCYAGNLKLVNQFILEENVKMLYCSTWNWLPPIVGSILLLPLVAFSI